MTGAFNERIGNDMTYHCDDCGLHCTMLEDGPPTETPDDTEICGTCWERIGGEA